MLGIGGSGGEGRRKEHVTADDVRHVAALARLGLDDARIPALVAELNGILGHMGVLRGVNTNAVQPATGVGAGGMPLRTDEGPPFVLHHPVEDFAPAVRDGFLLVPRLASHAEAGASADAVGAAIEAELAEPSPVVPVAHEDEVHDRTVATGKERKAEGRS